MFYRKLNSSYKVMRKLLLLSGGIDSTTIAHVLHKEGHDVLALTIRTKTGRDNFKEVDCATATAKLLGFDHKIVDLTPLGEIFSNSATVYSAGGQAGGCVPRGMRGAQLSTELMHFTSMMCALEAGIDTIVLGYNKDDLQEDTRNSFEGYLKMMVEIARVRTGKVIWFEMPLIDKTKETVILLGESLGVDMSATFSCSLGTNGQPCNECNQCLSVAGAMQKLQLS